MSQREHLYVWNPAWTDTYGERFILKALLETCTRVRQLIRHIRARVWKFAPLDSAYGHEERRTIMAAIWGSPNIAMACVHNCREWLLHHVAWQLAPRKRFQTDSCCRKTKQKTVFLFLPPPPQRNTQSQKREGWKAESLAALRWWSGVGARKGRVTCSSTRRLNVYLLSREMV